MSETVWQVLYYDRDGANEAPVRSELIEAESESAALALARQHCGQAKRVEVARPRWEGLATHVLTAGEQAPRR